ncbi:MAG TPA: 7-cyano-7-deazaguanine synthase [Dehalococcoidia bacterium]|nr:7-cyano-7-deazaguanine synthase [Dehalococcoidia bacterium]
MEEINVIEGLNFIHLFSGGLDSAYSLLKLAKDHTNKKKSRGIHPIFMDYGQYAASTEWNQVQQLTMFISNIVEDSFIHIPIRINLDSDLFKWCHNVAFTGKEVGDANPEIQNRNMVLLSILFSFLLGCAQNQGVTRADFEISSGFKDGEMGDCSATFFDALTDIFRSYHGEHNMKIILLPPLSRKQVYARIKTLLGGSQNQLELFSSMTTSCYSPVNGKACGSCWKCRRIAEEK